MNNYGKPQITCGPCGSYGRATSGGCVVGKHNRPLPLPVLEETVGQIGSRMAIEDNINLKRDVQSNAKEIEDALE